MKTQISRNGKYICFICVDPENQYSTTVYEIDRVVEETKESEEEAFAKEDKFDGFDQPRFDAYGNLIKEDNEEKGIYDNNKIKMTEIKEFNEYGVEAKFDEDEPSFLEPSKELEWRITNDGDVVAISFNQRKFFINGVDHFDQLEHEIR